MHSVAGWEFAPFADGNCAVRIADLQPGAPFYAPDTLQQLGDEMRREAGRGKHTMAHAAAAVCGITTAAHAPTHPPNHHPVGTQHSCRVRLEGAAIVPAGQVINVDDPASAANWVGDAASGVVLSDAALWRDIYELQTFGKPTVSLLHPASRAGAATNAGPSLLASIVVAKKYALVGVAVPAAPVRPFANPVQRVLKLAPMPTKRMRAE